MMAFDIVDDSFTLVADSALNVLVNDTAGVEVQNVSAINVVSSNDGTVVSNTIPDRPGQAGVPQRSVFTNALTVNPIQNNRGDIDLYLDNDDDGANDDLTTITRVNQSGGLVLGTLRDNSELDSAGTNLAVVQYTANAAGEAWIATNAAPNNAGEAEADFSAAYFPYASGWRGASFDGETVTSGDSGFVSTGSAGNYEITVSGVVDSFNDGFLFAVGGDNSDNYTRVIPLGGDRWSLVHRDNANGFTASDTAAGVQRFNLLYIPRSAQGLIGGTVNGSSAVANPMIQSFGDFNVQRQSDGIWKLSVPGQDITTGMVVMETADASLGRPRNTYFTYDVDPSDSSAILLRQFDYNGPNADLANEDFTFFFVPFDDNTLAPASSLVINRLGSSELTLDDNTSALGVTLGVNSDGTVDYATGTSILGLRDGETATDTFFYEVIEIVDEVEIVHVGSVTVNQVGVNDAPVAIGEPADLSLSRDGAALDLEVASLFDDVDTTDVLTYSVSLSETGVVNTTVSGGAVTFTPVAGATGAVVATITATDLAGASASVTTNVAVLGLQAIDDQFFITADATLSVLNNDVNGSESQSVSAVNVLYNRDTIDKASNFAEVFIPERTGLPGVPQRSVFTGALTVSSSQRNHADIPVYTDLDADPGNDDSTSGLQRIAYEDGIVLGSTLGNDPLDATATNFGLVKYTGFSGGVNGSITTDAGPQNDGERATDFSAAFFPYSAGWVGGSFGGDGTAGNGTGSGLTVTADNGIYTVEVDGVTDSFNEGFLFAIGGENGDDYVRARPNGGNQWLVQSRDNAAFLTETEAAPFNLLYIPRNSQGLVGGVVNGSSDVTNPMRQSFGEFTVDRESDGFWRVNVPGHSPTSGVLIMESMDLSADQPRNSYFSYEAAADDADDFIIRQFDFDRGSNTANPQNGDFVFFFVPFENLIQSGTQITVGNVGSSLPTLGDNVSANGVSLTVNADGTIDYTTGGLIRPLAEGETATDTFVYEAVFGNETVTATATVNLVGANDAPDVLFAPGEIGIVEDNSTTLDLATVFADVDNNDLLTYSVEFADPLIAEASVSGTVLTISGRPDRFGYVVATVTATDLLGATASVQLDILVTADGDGPTAVEETTPVRKTGLSLIDVTANDFHADAGPNQVVGANIFGNTEAVGDADTIWSIEQTGASPNTLSIISPANRGDVAVAVDGVPLSQRDGVLLGTIRNDALPFGSVNTYTGFGGGSFPGVPVEGAYTFATDLGEGGNQERNASIGAAFLPFAENWVGGHVQTNGTLLLGNGVNQSNVSKVPETTGLWTVSIPGVTDSVNDGLLFVQGGNNDDNLMSVLPLGGDTWLIRQLDNDGDSLAFENDGFSFVYVPIDSPSLVAGRWSVSAQVEEGFGESFAENTGIDLTTGNFTATQDEFNTVIIDIPNVTPEDGALIVVPTGAQSILLPDGSTVEVPVPNAAFYATTADNKFIVDTRASQTFSPIDSGFQFIFVPFETPLQTSISSLAEFTLTGVDATSGLGATLQIVNGQVEYDPSSATAAVTGLAPGESIIDTFTYTITDGNGLTSTGTASVEVFGSNPPTGIALSGDEVIENVDTSTGNVLIGTLLTEAAVPGEAYTYALTTGGAGTDNATFDIVDDQLFIREGTNVDFEAQSAYTIEVQSTNVDGDSISVLLTVNVIDVDEPDSVGPRITDVIVTHSGWSASFIDVIDGDANNGLGLSLPGADQMRNLPWMSGIDTVYVEFDEDVSAAFVAANLSLLGSSTDFSSTWTLEYDSENNRGKITLATAVTADALRLTVFDTLTDAAGNALDGEWINMASEISGDSNPGGSFDFRMDILAGDTDDSDSVNVTGDLLSVFAQNGLTPGTLAESYFDVDASGSVNVTGDVLAIFSINGSSLPSAPPGSNGPSGRGRSAVGVIDDLMRGIGTKDDDLFDGVDAGGLDLDLS